LLAPVFAAAALLVGLLLQYILEVNSGSSLVNNLCSNVDSKPLTLLLTERKPHLLSLRMKLRKMTLLKYLGRITLENSAGSLMAK